MQFPKSIFERINNSLDPYTGAVDIMPEEVPYAVVWPASTEEVSKVMAYANSKQIPVYVRGSGTSLHGAAKFHQAGHRFKCPPLEPHGYQQG